jgi:hypothetical protein
VDIFSASVGDLPTVDGGAIVLQSAVDHDTADGLYREARALEKAIKADTRYVKAKAKVAELRAAMRLVMDQVAVRTPLLRDAVTAYRRAEEEKARKKAQAEAEAEQARLRAAQEAEAAELREQAKKRRGQFRKDLLEQAESAEKTPLPSVDSAVARALAKQEEKRRDAGHVPTSRTWRAEVDEVGLVAAAVVASDETLFDLAKSMVNNKGMDKVTAEALVGLKREKGALVASPYLNQQARAREANLSIPGVRAVSVETVVNR